MEKLFTPFSVKSLYLKNRIVMPALASFLIEDDGSYTSKTVEHYRLRAAGGPAMVIVEAHSVAPEGVVSMHQARLYHDRFIEGLYKIADAIRSEGSIPAIQIHHAGRQVPFRVINKLPFAPSPIPCPTIQGEVHPLTIEEIQKLIIQFGDAAERAVQAGLELVEIHGAHGYLVNQFLSRFSNVRDDEYGGDIIGRSRFATEIMKEVRKRIGPDFPISFKISAEEFVPDGLTTDESILILKHLVKYGINLVQVSAGNDATPEWIAQPMFMEKACLASYSKKIKASLDIPVMLVGRINDPRIADSILKENKADLVCMGRGLLADPELPKKAQAGRFDDIRTCIACNTCMQSIFRRGRIECLVNPNLGRESDMVISPSSDPKKIMVIGAGPGGLTAARIAAERGHSVSLYEKHSYVGGQLILGSKAFYKKELRHLLDFLRKQIEKNGVTLNLNHYVTVDTIKRENPDVLIISTGSIPAFPPIEGIDLPIVLSIPEILDSQRSLLMKNFIIVGGGASGCEIALELSEKECQVVIVEQLSTIGTKIEAITMKMIRERMKRNGVKILTEHRVTRICEYGVFVIGKDMNEFLVEGERVIIATGNKPDSILYDEVKPLGIKTYQVGDSLEVRSAKEAIYEGALIGMSV